MGLKIGKFDSMAEDIRHNDNQIVVFGVGVIGLTILPQILKDFKLLDRVLYFVDNDKSRWNTTVELGGRQIKVYSPDILKKENLKITILISMSRFSGALEQIKRMKIACTYYIIPSMCLDNFRSYGGDGVICTSNKPIIPKIIHYMWLGKQPMPSNLLYCIESWKKYCPDYEIIRWDESNYDVHKNKFVSQAYDYGKYGFVPDYARLEILYEYGGIYLDTDVELKRNIDALLFQNAFCGVEKWQVLNFGGCSGAEKGCSSLLPFLESWKQRSLIRDDGTFDNLSSGLIDTSIAIKNGYKINGKNQTVMGMNIYTYDYFHPYDYMSGKLDITSNTFSVHHFNGGWLSENTIIENNKQKLFYDSIISLAEEM